MPSEDTKILELNHYQKSDKASFFVYTDLKWLVKKMNGCKNNPENWFTTNIGENIPSSISMSTIFSFKSIGNNHDVCRSKDPTKKCKFSRDHAS